VTPCNCWPLSMFQSTIRSDFGADTIHRMARSYRNDGRAFHIYTVAVTATVDTPFGFALSERGGALQRCRPDGGK